MFSPAFSTRTIISNVNGSHTRFECLLVITDIHLYRKIYVKRAKLNQYDEVILTVDGKTRSSRVEQ